MSLVLVREPIGHTVGTETLIADIAGDMQAFRLFLGLKTVAALRVIKGLEVDCYDALPFVG